MSIHELGDYQLDNDLVKHAVENRFNIGAGPLRNLIDSLVDQLPRPIEEGSRVRHRSFTKIGIAGKPMRGRVLVAWDDNNRDALPYTVDELERVD